MKKLDLQIGDRLTYKCDGEIHTLVITDKHDLDTYSEYSSLLEVLKIERPKYETIYEKKEILDEAEKEYLKNVIKPFRNIIDDIRKSETYDKDKEFIIISMNDGDYLSFPLFKKGTMYKGMETRKDYTLKELGL